MAYLLQLHTIYLLPAIELIITSTGNMRGHFLENSITSSTSKDAKMKHSSMPFSSNSIFSGVISSYRLLSDVSAFFVKPIIICEFEIQNLHGSRFTANIDN